MSTKQKVFYLIVFALIFVAVMAGTVAVLQVNQSQNMRATNEANFSATIDAGVGD